MDNTDELRIALVMNGGVSLAVWIGGVTAEFGRLVAAERQYSQLLSLLRWTPRIDVIAGSSAGGVNGAYLALALKYHTGAELTSRMTQDLRNVWIVDGAINALLRDPTEPAAASLLDGDGYYFKRLRDAFRTLKGGRPPAIGSVPIDLVLTATLLNGQPENLADDYGNPVPDVSHRARFHFGCKQTIAGLVDDFDDPLIADRLALAARSTSSFPAAFEPSFCPIRAEADDGQIDPGGRPFMNGIASFEDSRFVIDGGVLDNKPLDLALDCIFAKPADNPARRVLAYVVPDPGNVQTGSPDDPAKVPAALPVIFDSTLVIPSVQSVTNDITRLRAHNDQVRRRRRGRTLVTRYSTPEEVDSMANILFLSYRDMRLALAFDEIIDALNSGYATHPEIGDPLRDKGGRKEWLRREISVLIDAIPWVPNISPLVAAAVSEQGIDGWAWGTRTIVYLAQLNRDLLVRLQRCRSNQTGSGGTGELWKQAFNLIEQARRARADDAGFWMQDEVLKKVKEEVDSGSSGALKTARDAWLLSLLQAWRSGQRANSGRLARKMAQFVLDLNRYFRGLAEPVAPDARMEFRDLGSLLRYLVRQDLDRPETVLQRLLAFAVVDQTLGSEEELREQAVDFIQLSGNDDTLTERSRTAAEKLNGLQLGHFGAFYKPSWRANDWLWGRRDAVPRILRILLDPARLLWIAREIDGLHPVSALLAKFESLILSFGESDEARTFYTALWESRKAAIAAELNYVGDQEPVIPDSLTALGQTLTRAFDIEILRAELPSLATQIIRDKQDRMAESNAARAVADAVQANAGSAPLPAATAGFLARGSLLGAETWKDEVGTDPASFTVAKALAVAVTSLRAENGAAAQLGRAVAVLRIPTLILYGVANSLLIGSRTAAAVSGALVAAAAAIVVTWLAMAHANYPDTVLISAWAVLVAASLIALLRAFGRGRWGWLFLPVTLVASLTVATHLGHRTSPPEIFWVKLAVAEGAVLLVLIVANLAGIGRRLGKLWLRS